MEEPSRNTNHPEKYPIRQYYVDKPYPELRPILQFVRHQKCTFRSVGFMDKRSIVLYLNRKGWTAQVMHDDLVATLGEEALAYITVTNYPWAARIIPRDATQFSDAISPHIDLSDEAILRALEELSFSSVRQLTYATHLPVITVYWRLSAKLGFTPRHLRWVPHIVSDHQKATRVKCSRSLLTILRGEKTRAWQDIVTLIRPGSTPLQIMNSYCSILMEKFRIGTSHASVQQSDA
jgi:hypothetical protein